MIRAFLLLFALCPVLSAAPPNLLIITTDDMSCDSVGIYGCKLKDTTPNMGRLAAQTLRFNHAHVVVRNCRPSRNVMWSGKNQRGHRCPHRPLRSSRARGSLRSALRPGCAHQSHRET